MANTKSKPTVRLAQSCVRYLSFFFSDNLPEFTSVVVSRPNDPDTLRGPLEAPSVGWSVIFDLLAAVYLAHNAVNLQEV